MAEEYTNTQVTDIPEYMKKFQTTSDPNYTGILDEAMRQYRSRTGNLTDQQLADLQMPMRTVAGRTPLQQQGTTLAQQGVGAYMPMLQEGAYTVGSGVQSLAGAGNLAGGAYQGAIPYRDFAVSQLQAGIPQIQQAGARGELAAAGSALGIAGAGGLGQQAGFDAGRNIMQAGQQAGSFGQYGMDAAQAGIAGLQGSAAEFDPSSITNYMNPYEQSVIDSALADVARAGQKQMGQLGASAVSSGAFGGARQGIAEGEISRNVLEQQAKTAAGLRQSGYESAAQRAQTAYEAAKGRQQSGASLTGQLGQAGAATGLNATQLGMGAAQQAGAAQMAGARMGMQGAQQAGQMGLAGAQMGMQGAGQAAGLGQQVGQVGQQYGQLGLSTAGQMAGVGQGLGSLGMQQAQLGEAAQGLNLNDVNTLQSMGQQEQGQAQREMDALYANQYSQYQQPMQELGFYSDIYQGMPIGQSTYSQRSEPSPSTLSQLGGLAGGLYGMYRAQ